MIKEADPSLDADPSIYFRQFYPRLYGFVSASTGAPRCDVEDIVQETLLQAWRDRARDLREASAFTWVVAIARHRIADFFRRRSRGEKTDRILRALARLDSERVPEEVLECVELGMRVRAALHALPADQARLLVQRYLEGRQLRRIAEDSRESEAAVESRLRRAHEALRKNLTEGVNDHE